MGLRWGERVRLSHTSFIDPPLTRVTFIAQTIHPQPLITSNLQTKALAGQM